MKELVSEKEKIKKGFQRLKQKLILKKPTNNFLHSISFSIK